MKVTVIQQDIVWKDVQTNIARIKKLIMAAERSDIYVLPEMCSTGFCMQPQGVAVVIEADHLCMTMRGARASGAETRTSALRGTMRSDSKTRAEAISLLTGGR